MRTVLISRQIIREEGGGGSWWSSWFDTGIGRMIKGVIKLVLASLVISLINTIPSLTQNITINGQSIPVTTIVQVIVAFVPIFLILSALRDFDIRL